MEKHAGKLVRSLKYQSLLCQMKFPRPHPQVRHVAIRNSAIRSMAALRCRTVPQLVHRTTTSPNPALSLMNLIRQCHVQAALFLITENSHPTNTSVFSLGFTSVVPKMVMCANTVNFLVLEMVHRKT